YADDLILMAASAHDLQVKLDGLATGLETCGMSLNLKKSAALTVEKDGRTKTMLLCPTQYTSAGGSIAPMGVLDTQKYLGRFFTWKGKVIPTRTVDLERMLAEIRAAPLKPQQRIMIVTDFMIPRLIHELVLGHAHRNTLRRMDVMIRRAAREWLRLPKDTSLGLLHAPSSRGGLSIPSLESTIPLAQKRRFEKLLNGAENLIQAVTHTKAFRSILRRTAIPVKAGGSLVVNASEAKEEWVRKLCTSIDGRELAEPDVDEGSHLWLRKPDRVFPRLYIRGIQLRGGTLSTKSRASRGRASQEDDRRCRGGCANIETLNHILQSCARTHDSRCARHNRVMRLVCKKLHRVEFKISMEPIVPCQRTHIKPDIIVHRTESLVVMDITVVSGLRMKESWNLKVGKYGCET
ncbi:MAG: hypothetical protein ACRCT2_09440, partial [Plesiomonas shigelloides]